MPRPRHLLVPLLALLAGACGGSETASTKFIAQSRAEAFETTLASLEANLDAGRCNAAQQRINGLRGQVDEWPDAYDARLEANVREWIDQIERRLDADCRPERTPTPTPTEEPTVEPTVTPEATPTPEATETPEETATPEPTPDSDIPDAIPTPEGQPPDTGGAPGQDG